MPDEFDYKNYKSIEDFGKTLEGSKYYHDLYLKAVNHPIRREILKIINSSDEISENKLFSSLIKQKILTEKAVLDYNINFLIKALCIEKLEIRKEIYYRITQSGKVIEYF